MFNNIRVENSTVGVINTGDVKAIDSVVSTVSAQGNQKLATGLRDFTQAVIDDPLLAQENKNEALSQLSFLSHEVIADQKQPATIIRSIMTGVERAINGSASLVTLWPLLHEALKPVLGF